MSELAAAMYWLAVGLRIRPVGPLLISDVVARSKALGGPTRSRMTRAEKTKLRKYLGLPNARPKELLKALAVRRLKEQIEAAAEKAKEVTAPDPA